MIDDGRHLTLLNSVLNRIGLVIEWAFLHQTELMENWELVRRQIVLQKIEPLE